MEHGGSVGSIATNAASAAFPGGGNDGLLLSNDVATLDLIGSVYSNIWVQVYAKPITGTADPKMSGVNGAFYLRDDGSLRAYTGEWQTVLAGVPTNRYLGFTMHLDYATDKWNLYYGSGPYKTSHIRIATLDFACPATAADQISLESGATAYFDGVAVSRGFEIVSNPGAQGASTNIQSIEYGAVSGDFDLPIYSDKDDGTTHDTLGPSLAPFGSVGDDLLSGFVAGDTLHMLTTTNAPAQMSTLSWMTDPVRTGLTVPTRRLPHTPGIES